MELDRHWFEWAGRLVLDRREVDRFEKQTRILIKALRGLSLNRRRYHYQPHPHTHAFTGYNNPEQQVSRYPDFQSGRCVSCG